MYFSTSQTAAFVFFTCTPHLCYDKQGPTLFPFQKPYKKDTLRSDSSETWLQLGISLPFWGEGKARANGRCCCPFILRDRSVSNIISFNSLVDSILHSEASQTRRSTACKYACGKDHLQLSATKRKGEERSGFYIQYSFSTYISESSKSCAVNACFSLKPKHCILTLLLSKL